MKLILLTGWASNWALALCLQIEFGFKSMRAYLIGTYLYICIYNIYIYISRYNYDFRLGVIVGAHGLDCI